MGTKPLAKTSDLSPTEENLPTRQLRPRNRRESQVTSCPICHRHVSTSAHRKMETRQHRLVCSCQTASTSTSTTSLTKASRTRVGSAKTVRRKQSKKRIKMKTLETKRLTENPKVTEEPTPSTSSIKREHVSIPSSTDVQDIPSVTDTVFQGIERMESESIDFGDGSSSLGTLKSNLSATLLVSQKVSEIDPTIDIDIGIDTSVTSGKSTGMSKLFKSEDTEESVSSKSSIFGEVWSGSVRRVFSSEGDEEVRLCSDTVQGSDVPYASPGTSRQGLRSRDKSPVPGTSRQGLRSANKPAEEKTRSFKSKKDFKNEEHFHKMSQLKGASGSSHTETESLKVPEAEVSHGRKSKGRHICPICSKPFGSPGKLGQHMYSHTGERPFECKECPKAFSSKFKLVRHVLIHSDERKYRCTVCERTFHRKDHLKNHVKVHSPIKKIFRCEKEDCGKEYSSFLSYRKHTAAHAAEEGNLECKMCGKVFATKDEIVYHLKVHAGSRTVKNPSDKKYRCDHCERKFFTRKDVRRHLVVHTGKRDFLCQFCPQRFGRKDHLVRHIKKSHHGGSLARKGKRLRAPATVVRDPGIASTSSTSMTSRKTSAEKPSTSKSPSYTESASSSTQPPRYTTPDPVIPLPETSVTESEDVLILKSSPSSSNNSLKIATLETMLQSPPFQEVSGVLKSDPALIGDHQSAPVHHRPETLESEHLMPSLVYSHPPPPYPTDLQPQFKVFEEVCVKLEPQYTLPSPSRLGVSTASAMDLNHLLSLLPSTSQSVPHLPEGLVLDSSSGGLLVQQMRREELQQFLAPDDEHLMVGDPNLSSQFLHLMESPGSLEISADSASVMTENLASQEEETNPADVITSLLSPGEV